VKLKWRFVTLKWRFRKFKRHFKKLKEWFDNFFFNLPEINDLKADTKFAVVILKDFITFASHNSNKMSAKDNIIKDRMPTHVAIIMDGNGRWAKRYGQQRIFGHQNGITAVRNVTEAAAEEGVKVLTLYTFSTENWNRPEEEINALMSMLVNTIAQEEKTLMDNNIALQTIGDTDALPVETRETLLDIMEKTKDNKRMTLVLALNYSSRWEITKAVQEIATAVVDNRMSIDDITQQEIGNHLSTRAYPDPDLLIRTSGEYRLSNYLLWQLAYTELYFTPILWPDFTKENFYEAIVNFQKRERRYGKTSEQLQ
jgi:undecaprenyl diphosphate synthase